MVEFDIFFHCSNSLKVKKKYLKNSINGWAYWKVVFDSQKLNLFLLYYLLFYLIS